MAAGHVTLIHLVVILQVSVAAGHVTLIHLALKQQVAGVIRAAGPLIGAFSPCT